MDQRTHTGGLFCQEGSTHVGRPSIKVRQTPGGNSNWTLGSMVNGDPYQKAAQSAFVAPAPANAQQRAHAKQEITGKIGGSVAISAPANNNYSSSSVQYNEMPKENQSPNVAQSGASSSGWSNNNAPIYCNEGSQMRNKPSIKVRQNPGGSSSWNFLKNE